jgi:hypothetical protein
VVSLVSASDELGEIQSSFSPDGRYLSFARAVWDLQTSRPVTGMTSSGGRSPPFSPGGRYWGTTFWRVEHLAVEHLAKELASRLDRPLTSEERQRYRLDELASGPPTAK